MCDLARSDFVSHQWYVNPQTVKSVETRSSNGACPNDIRFPLGSGTADSRTRTACVSVLPHSVQQGGGAGFPVEDLNSGKDRKVRIALESRIVNVAEQTILRAAVRDWNRIMQAMPVRASEIWEDTASAVPIAKMANETFGVQHSHTGGRRRISAAVTEA